MEPEDDAIGLVRAHRWAGVTAQTRRLKEAGCTRIFDLDKQDRTASAVLGRRRVLLVYAFLLAKPALTRGMWADFLASLDRIEARKGVVVDVGTGLNSLQHKAEFRAVIRDQVRRHNQGEKSGENHPKGAPGRPEAKYSRGDWRLAHTIWHDIKTYPTWDSAKEALARIRSSNTNEPFSVARAHKKWNGRPKPKD
jgi:hypothetical protein